MIHTLTLIRIELNDLQIQKLQGMSFEDQKAWDDAMTNKVKQEEELKNLEAQTKDAKERLQEKAKEASWYKGGTNFEMPPELKQQVDEQCASNLPDVKARLENLRNQEKEIPPVSPAEITEVKDLEKNQEKQEKEIKLLEKDVNDLTVDLRR